MDRNNTCIRFSKIGCSRSLRGNVDRNKIIDDAACDEEAVVPYVGTWIEIMYESNFNNAADVVPYVGTWIEMF